MFFLRRVSPRTDTDIFSNSIFIFSAQNCKYPSPEVPLVTRRVKTSNIGIIQLLAVTNSLQMRTRRVHVDLSPLVKRSPTTVEDSSSLVQQYYPRNEKPSKSLAYFPSAPSKAFSKPSVHPERSRDSGFDVAGNF